MATNSVTRPRPGTSPCPRRREEPYAADVLAQLYADAEQVVARYPQKRSALLPLLHLVQSVDGYITGRHRLLRRVLDLSRAEVSGVATFYTRVQAPPQRRVHRRRLHQHAVRDHGRRPDLGGRLRAPRRRPRRDHPGRQDHPRAGRVQRRVRLRPCRHGELGVLRQPDPGVDQAAGRRPARGQDVAPTRGPSRVCTFKQVSPASTTAWPTRRGGRPGFAGGLRVAREHSWTAPRGADASTTRRRRPAARRPGGSTSVNAPTNEPDELLGGEDAKEETK